MTVQSATRFDVDEFAHAHAEWDIDALLDLYVDDVELIQIDRDNPPSAPRVRHGRDMLRGMFEHCAGVGVKATVRNAVADGPRAAAMVTCEFPGGGKVLADAIFEIADGRIVREHDVLSGDPKGT